MDDRMPGTEWYNIKYYYLVPDLRDIKAIINDDYYQLITIQP
jgi:hypothetical protein